MVDKNNQREKVLEWLQKRGSLTVRDAVIELGINSLPKRIEELRKEGYKIKTEWITSKSGVRYGLYRLIEEGEK